MSSKEVQAIYRDSKRNRRPTSCEQCRIRKAKCNRELPCENCSKRGEKASCRYATNAIRNANKRRNSNVAERLRRVEKLVSELVGSSEGNQTEKAVMVERRVYDGSFEEKYGGAAAGPLSPRKTKGQIANSHWLSILDDIKEVREQLAESDVMTTPDDGSEFNEDLHEEEIDLNLGATRSLPSLQEIIASLPPRPICDMFLSIYFNSPMVLPIVHSIKFQTEYEKFWQDPSKAPVLWIGLLYSILACVASFQQAMKPTTAVEDISKPQPALSVKHLRSTTVQCLILGKYTNGAPYALETLIMHLLGTYIGKTDSSFEGWFLMGTVIRLAMRMGYHRDPNKTQKGGDKITPFEAEMRRRRWHAILQLDTLMSFQMGMPVIIPQEFCDTEPPRNLNDEEIWPTMQTLPPSRPVSDYTPILYTITKTGVMNMFRKVLIHSSSSSSSSSLDSSPYAMTIDLDAKLRKTYNSIPETLKWRPINQSFTVPAGLIICRSTIELLHLKSIIVLHRKYLTTERTNPQHDFSRRACITAALEVLARQTELHAATSNLHGRLYEERWMVSSLTAHDFLLADMVICLELSMLMRSSPSPSSARSQAHFSKLLDALLQSQRIWTSKSVYSGEARTAALTLQVMIDKVQQNSSSSCFATDNRETAIHTTPPSELQPRSTTETETEILPPLADTMTEMISSSSEDLDWTLLDQYLQNTASSTTTSTLTHRQGDGGVSYDEWGLLDMNMDVNIDMAFDGLEQHRPGYYPEYFGR